MEPDEFRKLLVKELDAVYRLAYHLAPGPQDVDDLVQETYFRAFRASEDFKLADYGVRPWLFKILHNVVHARWLKDRRQPALVDDLSQAVSPDHLHADDQPSELSKINWDRVDERLKAAIERLPLAHRTAFLLCAVEGLRYREIAAVMDVPVGTVMSRLHRARQTLAAELSGLGAELGLSPRGKNRDFGSNAGL